MGFHFRVPQQLVKTVTLTTIPERISSVTCPASTAIIIARKAEQTDNATDISIGVVSTDGKQPIPIAPGGQYVLSSVDLTDWYVDVQTNGDGVVVIYW